MKRRLCFFIDVDPRLLRRAAAIVADLDATPLEGLSKPQDQHLTYAASILATLVEQANFTLGLNDDRPAPGAFKEAAVRATGSNFKPGDGSGAVVYDRDGAWVDGKIFLSNEEAVDHQ